MKIEVFDNYEKFYPLLDKYIEGNLRDMQEFLKGVGEKMPDYLEKSDWRERIEDEIEKPNIIVSPEGEEIELSTPKKINIELTVEDMEDFFSMYPELSKDLNLNYLIYLGAEEEIKTYYLFETRIIQDFPEFFQEHDSIEQLVEGVDDYIKKIRESSKQGITGLPYLYTFEEKHIMNDKERKMTEEYIKAMTGEIILSPEKQIELDEILKNLNDKKIEHVNRGLSLEERTEFERLYNQK